MAKKRQSTRRKEFANATFSDQGPQNPKLGNRAPQRNAPPAPTSGMGSLGSDKAEWDYFQDPRQPGKQLNGAPDASLTPARITQSVRMRINPIRGLTPERLVSYLDQWMLGFFRLAGLLFDAMERRDYQIKTVAPKRKKSIARLGYDIVTTDEVPPGQAALAKQQQEFLKEFWDNISVTTAMDADERGGFALLVRQMMDAVGKKYAVHEIVWQPGTKTSLGGVGRGEVEPASGEATLTAQFIHCPIWWFEGTRGKLRFLQSEFQVYGTDMLPGDWLVTVHDGVMEACSLIFLFKHLPLKSWVSYLDKFGMPGLHGKTDAAYGTKEWNDFVEAVQNFAEDWSAVTNRSGEINLVEASKGAGAGNPFETIVEKMDKALTTLWLGADLGTSSKKDHAGASLQGDDTAKLEIDDTQIISETLNSQVSDLALEWRFGVGCPKLAYLKIRVAEDKDIVTDQTVDAWLVNSGFPLTFGYVAEKYSRALPPDADPNELLKPSTPKLSPPSPGGEGDPSNQDDPADVANEAALEAAAKHEYVKALATDLQPVLDQLNSILAISDPDIMERRLRAFIAKLPQLTKDLSAHPEAADALYKSMSAALASGLSKGPPK